jgi:PIN domain nuclease of toxin-antitoxin system
MAARNPGELREAALKLLLDTNVLLWWMGRDDPLQFEAGRLIAEPENEILLSVVSLWEIAIKNRVGKLDVSIDEIIAVAATQDFKRIGIEDAHFNVLNGLPRHHGDPFDHLLIAQAIAENAAFVTRDRTAARYPVEVIAVA